MEDKFLQMPSVRHMELENFSSEEDAKLEYMNTWESSEAQSEQSLFHDVSISSIKRAHLWILRLLASLVLRGQ